MNYSPYISLIFWIKQKQRNMRIHQPFSIVMIRVHFTSILLGESTLHNPFLGVTIVIFPTSL